MKTHRIASVEPLAYPVLRVTFADAVSGELDLSESIVRGGVFASLASEDFFRTVAVDENGRTFGWNLDKPGEEIDFCPDTTRIRIETQRVEELAARFRVTRVAAE